MKVGDGKVSSSKIGIIRLPHLPDDTDWGLKLIYEGPVDNAAVAAKVASSETTVKKEPNKRLIIGLVIAGLFLISYVLIRKGKSSGV